LRRTKRVPADALEAYIPTAAYQQVLAMMPMYYLHIRDRDHLELDPDGTELPDLDAVCADALRMA
jgi:hypothetical protein